MEINTIDRLKIIKEVYSIIPILPNLIKKAAAIFRPMDVTRYTEFSYLHKFMLSKNLNDLDILDVSSPHMMAYIHSKNNRVIKTNIDTKEKTFIKENKNLKFKIEDATHLSFPDNSFDLVYSISVIEHIYKDFLKAILEMIRVTRPNGYIYLTFPVSRKHIEEWSDSPIYSHQFIKGEKKFFQYRFAPEDIANILSEVIKKNVIVVEKDIFWEKREGIYDTLVQHLNARVHPTFLNFIKIFILNAWYGFKLFENGSSKDFSQAKLFGNMHIILQKR